MGHFVTTRGCQAGLGRLNRARTATIRPLLESLAALGHARATEAGRFAV